MRQKLDGLTVATQKQFQTNDVGQSVECFLHGSEVRKLEVTPSHGNFTPSISCKAWRNCCFAGADP